MVDDIEVIFQDDLYDVTNVHHGVKGEFLAGVVDLNPASKVLPVDHSYSYIGALQSGVANEGAQSSRSLKPIALDGPRPEPLDVVPSTTDQAQSLPDQVPSLTVEVPSPKDLEVSASDPKSSDFISEEITEVIKMEKVEEDSTEKSHQVRIHLFKDVNIFLNAETPSATKLKLKLRLTLKLLHEFLMNSSFVMTNSHLLVSLTLQARIGE